MRKPITLIAAVTALAATSIVPVAQASTGAQQHKDNPAVAVAPVQLGDASIDGFKAWSEGAHNITNKSAVITVKYNKDLTKTWLTGMVGVQVLRDDINAGWQDADVREVLATSGDVSWDVDVPYPNKGHRPLTANHTYKYHVFIEYKWQRYYSPTATFTTTK